MLVGCLMGLVVCGSGTPWTLMCPFPEALHAMQGSSGLNSFLSRVVPFMRDRLLADPRYCFIVLAEVGIDTGCATVAEVRCPVVMPHQCVQPRCKADQSSAMRAGKCTSCPAS